MKSEFHNYQYESACPDGIENHWWYLARNRIIANTIRTQANPNAAILDVGCGKGITVKYLRDRGINCFGAELAEVKPLAAVEKYIYVGINAADIPNVERQRYETILLLDVIEHIHDPVEFIQNLVAAFPRLSHLIITVPARPELWSDYDEFYSHYKRYTIEMLNSLSFKLNVKRSHLGYFFHLVYIPAWLQAILKKKRKIGVGAPHGLSQLVHKIVSYAMLLDYYVLPKRVVGTSLLAYFSLGSTPARQKKD